jgi:methionyl aminopeptidase
MDIEIEKKYVKAGKIASQVREAAVKKAAPGMKLLELADFIENQTKKLGGEIAFPANLSLNEVAAHYTPTKEDETLIPENGNLKIDIGVHIDGYVADTAKTATFGNADEKLSEASASALDEAIKLVKPGAKLSDISKKIEDTITSFGFKPVSNLTGHGVDNYFLHASPQIPNIATNTSVTLEEGQVIAIEPFATDGRGSVKDGSTTLIYMLMERKPVRNPDSRKIIEFAEKFNGLPFAERWIPFDSIFKTRIALRELIEKEIVYEYPPLVESGMVSQHEHTIIVKDKPIVTTL